MDAVIQLAAQMNWPFAAAAIGVSIAIGVPLMVRGISRNANATARIAADRDIELKRIETTLKNTAVPMVATKQPEY